MSALSSRPARLFRIGRNSAPFSSWPWPVAFYTFLVGQKPADDMRLGVKQRGQRRRIGMSRMKCSALHVADFTSIGSMRRNGDRAALMIGSTSLHRQATRFALFGLQRLAGG